MKERDTFGDCGPIVARRDHPELATRLQRMARRGQAVPVFRGIYLPQDLADDTRHRALAAMAWDPNATVSGRAAAKLTFWPELFCGEIQLCGPIRRVAPPGCRYVRRTVPPELRLVVEGIWVTTPVATGIELAGADGGEALDRALLAGATVADLDAAWARMRHYRGFASRKDIVMRSRTRPFSQAERRFHALLDEHGIGGWEGNVAIRLEGNRWILDVWFEEGALCVEVDGYEHHRDPRAFERDRRKAGSLVALGAVVLRFTWDQIVNDPAWVLRTLRAALEIRHGARVELPRA